MGLCDIYVFIENIIQFVSRDIKQTCEFPKLKICRNYFKK